MTTTPDEPTQTPDEIAAQLLERTAGDEVVLKLSGPETTADESTIRASIRRPLHLPSSVDEGVDGGSLRFAIEAGAETIERLELPECEGVIAAEEIDHGSWNRSRVQFYEVADAGDQDEPTEFGEQVLSETIAAIDAEATVGNDSGSNQQDYSVL
ncbi:hypothetical protein [Natrarchaeobaculum aegyptiacum]|uniref:Uncharacterized protein n=1 Tax=Natrarchaeobaculum aegyptiacum TaxID=745377 RepID=A0A2Z2HSI0_9EURY|nr:hypothetical protein [Natrarchaeobaculum aegyptiacum]ARS88347.1 hypothetical protein B1756_00305 [Natrarchaeobaculum aegyptiacum]